MIVVVVKDEKNKEIFSFNDNGKWQKATATAMAMEITEIVLHVVSFCVLV